MDNRRRTMLLVVAFMGLALSLACICGQCSNPFASLTQSSERASENEAVVGGVKLGDAVMARGIGDNNRPLSITNSFSDSEDVIYCVVEADVIPAGSSFYARWSYEGEPFEDTAVITADREYRDTYIEFHIEPTDFGVLKRGNYTVKIYVNGNPVKTVNFTVN